MEERYSVDRRKNLIIENAKIIFRNFAGAPDKFNPAGGQRKFSVFLDDPEFVASLKGDGWNVKDLKARDEEDDDKWHLPVKVVYKTVPPKIYLVRKGERPVLLSEETVSCLDHAEIENVDLCVTPYEWEVNGKTGIAAYVKEMYVVVEESDLASKYRMEDE